MKQGICAKDKVGRHFKAGDFIAYGHALGRCAGLRIGKVVDIRLVPDFDPWLPRGAVQDKLAYRITVVGVDDDRAANEPKLCKKGTLMYPDRCLLLTHDMVPIRYIKLYNEVGL